MCCPFSTKFAAMMTMYLSYDSSSHRIPDGLWWSLETTSNRVFWIEFFSELIHEQSIQRFVSPPITVDLVGEPLLNFRKVAILNHAFHMTEHYIITLAYSH
jgi:hypothetical protein